MLSTMTVLLRRSFLTHRYLEVPRRHTPSVNLNMVLNNIYGPTYFVISCFREVVDEKSRKIGNQAVDYPSFFSTIHSIVPKITFYVISCWSSEKKWSSLARLP